MNIFALNIHRGGISILGLVFLAILLIIVLSHYHVSLQSWVDNPELQTNFHYVWGGITYVWSNYLEQPVSFVWHHIILDGLKAIFHNGRSLNFNNVAPQVPGH
ncbi:MAG TPA: hypothetical protein VG694_00055 [Candidatus Paceibacterota bacterium]|nr:hypothetical protein [Candidatus Paceibacterota bacterium]